MRSNSNSEMSRNRSESMSINSSTMSNSTRAAVLHGTHRHEQRKVQMYTHVTADGLLRFRSHPNAEMVCAHIDQTMLTKIFTGTEKLNSDAILQFVRYLCQVSSAEIQNLANPRSFCLQKIVEIAHFNMNRVRYEWVRLWQILSEHFYEAACHENSAISMYAIDSLRQLADKFLEKEESNSFNV